MLLYLYVFILFEKQIILSSLFGKICRIWCILEETV